MHFATRVGVGATSGSASTLELEFLACQIGKTGQHIQSPAIRGSRDEIAETVVQGTFTVGGSLSIEPRQAELDFFLPKILGGGTNPTYTLAATVPEIGVDIGKVADSYRYAGMKINTATFRSGPNQPLQLEMDIQGKTETAGITFPSIASTVTNVPPYIHHEMVLTLGGTAYECSACEISIGNVLMLDRFMNSQSRTELPEQDRKITLKVTVPFSVTTLYEIAIAGIAGTVVYTKVPFSLGFAFDKLQSATKPVTIQGKNGELLQQLEFVARRNATSPTAALIVTHDSTT